MTENDIFNMPRDMASQNSIATDGIFSQMASVSLSHSNSLDLGNHNPIMAGYLMPSMLLGEPINYLHDCLHLANPVRIADSDALVPRNAQLGRGTIRDPSIGSSCLINNTEDQGELIDGIPLSAASVATLLAARCVPHENLDNLATSAPLAYPMEVIKPSVPTDYSHAFNSSFGTSLKSGYDGTLGHMSSNWDLDTFIAPPELARTIPARTGCLPLRSMCNMDPNGWITSENTSVSSDSPGSSRFGNELSLSLATCQPSVFGGISIPDQSSCSVVTSHSFHERGLGSEQTSCNSKSLSLSFGSYRPVQLSQVLSGSQYLRVMQEILADISSYSLENLDNKSYPANGIGIGASFSLSSGLPTGQGYPLMGSDEIFNGNDRFEVQLGSTLQGRETESKKKHLLALLQVVDERHNQCLDEIHKVISAFHAVTEIDPHIHARFAFQTILLLYKTLRERISNHILAMGGHFNKGRRTREEETQFETSFIQKQWALQQLRKKDHHQLWRPQRGLPERSVSVLRSWMFQNFLHPYPKDAEKHLLAVRSGLTRSQVSNWFINARVRLWKPMIDEMYAEMNRRKSRRTDEVIDSNRRNHISIQNRRF